MKHQNRINHLSDNNLLDEVKGLVRREKEIVVEVIEYLKEIELRKLHLVRGFSSMFSFAVEFLGYSEAEAHIRIQAARLTQALPEVKALIETGELSLSVAATTQAHFRKENIRRKEQGKPGLNLDEKRKALELVSGASRREAEHSLNIHFVQQSERKLSFSVSPELGEKIEKLLDLMAHKNFDRDIGKMVEILVNQELAKYEAKLDPSKRSRSDKPVGLLSPGSAEDSQPKSSRFIPKKIKSLVWAKYKRSCTFKDLTTGKVCGSQHGIEIDHLQPISLGGTSDLQNLTILCASHNKWKSNRVIDQAEQI